MKLKINPIILFLLFILGITFIAYIVMLITGELNETRLICHDIKGSILINKKVIGKIERDDKNRVIKYKKDSYFSKITIYKNDNLFKCIETRTDVY
ncbi:hypothetical protein HEMROJRC1_20520 [Rodentibacter sp. JRC1]|uniref:hypothetical protein n=1 Tax=Rodentibacter sp. JRC1 TaxID=2874504 RepID=UPI001CFED2A6|nr:hypothetical protein [Rodentibacter sp. JRC1]GJI56940.1 hypothetical protein HEMROJRC1_20520 [Rodentibacter sp. JRC1]